MPVFVDLPREKLVKEAMDVLGNVRRWGLKALAKWLLSKEISSLTLLVDEIQKRAHDLDGKNRALISAYDALLHRLYMKQTIKRPETTVISDDQHKQIHALYRDDDVVAGFPYVLEEALSKNPEPTYRIRDNAPTIKEAAYLWVRIYQVSGVVRK